MRWHRRTARALCIISVVATMVTGFSVDAAPKPSAPRVSLPTGRQAKCVKPRTTSQTVTLPSAGGITATFTIGPFPKGATQCLPIVIGTGDEILPLADPPADPPAAPSLARFAAAIGFEGAGSTAPLLTVTVGAGTDATPMIPFGGPVVVTGTKLTAATALKLADGTYYASVRRTDGTQSSYYPDLQFIAKGGVLRVAPLTLTETDGNGNQTKKALPLLQFTDTSFTISLYPLGVIPPAASLVPGASTTMPPDSSTPNSTRPALTTTVPPVPPHQPALKGAFGQPPPDWGTVIGSLTYEWSNCRNSQLCRWTSNVISSGGGDTPLYIPAIFDGEATFSLNLAYMVIRQITYENCPKEWSVFAGFDGSGTLGISGPTPNLVARCTIRLSTIPKGKNGTGYEMVLVVRGVDTGVRPT